jgi:hypothetical protein
VPEVAVEVEIAGTKGRLELGDKLTPEDATEHLDGQKKAAGRADPSGVIGRQAAGSQDAMGMRVELQSLVPGMQHTEEVDLRAQMTWVTGHFEQRLGTGVKQQVENRLFVLQGQRRQLARQSEYGMHIACRQ